MKKIINGVLPLLLLITLCSCGTLPSEQSTTQDVDTTSNAIFKNSETSAKENRLNNDFIRIWPSDASDESIIWMQENMDGTGKKSIDIDDLSYVLWVTNDWLYYSCGETGDSQSVFRVPVERKEDVTYDTARKEPLFELLTDGEIRETFFVTDDFIFYSQFDEDSELSTYYRYDLETGKSTKAFTLESGYEGLEAEMMQNKCTNLPIILEDSFFIIHDDGIYRVSFDTLEKEKICTGEDLHISGMAEHEGTVYFCGSKIAGEKNGVTQVEYSSTSISKYEGKNGEITTVLSDSELKKVLKQIEKANDINLIDKNCYYNINDLYTYKDRLYIQIHTEAGSGAYTQTSGKNVLLSAPFTNPDQWELESALTKYCLEQGMGNESLGVRGAAWIRELYNGKVLFMIATGIEETYPSISSVKYQGYDAIYDIDTGKIEKLDDEDYRIHQYHY